jgi:hypothetical protein
LVGRDRSNLPEVLGGLNSRNHLRGSEVIAAASAAAAICGGLLGKGRFMGKGWGLRERVGFQGEFQVQVGKTICLLVLLFCARTEPALAGRFVETDADGTKHIRAPFVNVDVKHHADGTKNVNVNAPFVRVHDPSGASSTQVKAPFTKVDRNDDGSPRVRAPFTRVDRNDDGSPRVTAPFTKVDRTTYGATRVQAPLAKVDHPNNGRATVSAPLTKVDRNSDGSARVKAPFTRVDPAANQNLTK